MSTKPVERRNPKSNAYFPHCVCGLTLVPCVWSGTSAKRPCVTCDMQEISFSTAAHLAACPTGWMLTQTLAPWSCCTPAFGPLTERWGPPQLENQSCCCCCCCSCCCTCCVAMQFRLSCVGWGSERRGRKSRVGRYRIGGKIFLIWSALLGIALPTFD